MEEMERTIERAYVENQLYDRLKHWKEYHPRTFWPTVEALSDLFEEQKAFYKLEQHEKMLEVMNERQVPDLGGV